MSTSLRLKKLQAICKEYKVEALLLSNTDSIFYMTGFGGFSSDEREGYALVTAKIIYVFTDARLINAISKIDAIKPIEISSQHPFRQTLAELCTKHHIKRVGFEPHNLTAAEFIAFRKLKSFTLIPLDLDSLREIKDSYEIEMIRNACQIGDKAFDYICGVIKPGLTEKQIASEIEIFFKKNLADISFPSIVAFGDHSAIPHHSPTDRALKKQEIIKLDFGCRWNKYCSDMTRTIFIGTPTTQQKEVYETVKSAQEKAFDVLQTSQVISGHDADETARNYIVSKGYPSIPHSLGHGIGIEVHEPPTLSPRSEKVLQPETVFSIEPGIYLRGKFGVRIEDIVVRTKDGIDILTSSPRQLISL